MVLGIWIGQIAVPGTLKTAARMEKWRTPPTGYAVVYVDGAFKEKREEEELLLG